MMTVKRNHFPCVVPMAGHGLTQCSSLGPVVKFKRLGIMICLLGLGIIACNVASDNQYMVGNEIFDIRILAGSLHFITGYLAVMTSFRSKRSLVLATLILCCLAILFDLICLATAARNISKAAGGMTPTKSYEFNTVDYAEQLPFNIAFVVMTVLSFVLLLALSILGCHQLNKNNDHDQDHVVYAPPADPKPLVTADQGFTAPAQFPHQFPPQYAQ